MKKRGFVICTLFVVLVAVVCVAVYHNTYPIKLNLVTLPQYVQKFHDGGQEEGSESTITLYGSGIGIGNKEYYLLDADGEFGYVALEKGLNGRYKILHISHGSGSFRTGILENDGQKYMVFAGLDPVGKICQVNIEIKGFLYEQKGLQGKSPFLFYVEVDDSISRLDLDLENIVFYDEEGTDITELYDLSGGMFQ